MTCGSDDCFGPPLCDKCEQEENDLQAAQRRYREEQEEQALLKAGKPTLKVTFGDLIRRREQR